MRFVNLVIFFRFLEYVNYTIIPAVLENQSMWLHEKIDKQQKYEYSHDFLRRKFPPDPPNMPDKSKNERLVLTPLLHRRWTREPALKIIGGPRLRQKRIQPGRDTTSQVYCRTPSARKFAPLFSHSHPL